MNSIFEHFLKLYRDNDQVSLLNWAYGIVALVMVFIAGLVALINQSAGVSLLIVPAICIAALCANVVAWSLICTLVTRREAKSNKKK